MSIEKFDQIYAILKSSPMYYLSLTSKELFHSNFLSWAIENVDGVKNIFLKRVNWDISLEPTDVLREAKNIDLWIKYDRGYNLIIENKVKSIPREEQLQQYYEERIKERKEGEEYGFILLSLTAPQFQDNNWISISYKELARELSSIAISNPYHRDLVNDYVQYVEQLVLLDEEIRVEDDTFFAFDHDEVWEKFNKMRLGDFYEKKRYEMLARKVFDRIKIDGEKTFGLNPVTTKAKVDIHYGDVFVSSGMSHSLGILDIKIAKGSGLFLGLQIQNGQLRHVIECAKTGGKAQSYIQDYQEWFYQNRLPENDKKTFNKFGDTFVYWHIPILMQTASSIEKMLAKEIAEILCLKAGD